MQQILELIQQHNDWFYLISFVWAALEGETFVIFAGLAAQRELLDIRLLFISAALGSMFGDQVMFFVGRKFGRRIVHRFPKIEPKLQKVFRAIEKYSISFILSYRFMYGVRNISAIALGMSEMSWRHFAIWNAVASFLWSFAFCAAGYLFGDVMQRMGFGNAEESVEFEVRGFMITILGLFLLFIAARVLYARHRAKAEAKEEAEAGNDKP